MDPQSELSQLQEVQSKLYEIEALNNEIAQKQNVIKRGRERAENVSVEKPYISREMNERERISSNNWSKNRKIYKALVAVTIIVYIVLAVVTLVLAYNFYSSALKNLSEGETLSLGVISATKDTPMEELTAGMIIYGIGGFAALCGLTIFILHKRYDKV